MTSCCYPTSRKKGEKCEGDEIVSFKEKYQAGWEVQTCDYGDRTGMQYSDHDLENNAFQRMIIKLGNDLSKIKFSVSSK